MAAWKSVNLKFQTKVLIPVVTVMVLFLAGTMWMVNRRIEPRSLARRPVTLPLRVVDVLEARRLVTKWCLTGHPRLVDVGVELHLEGAVEDFQVAPGRHLGQVGLANQYFRKV